MITFGEPVFFIRAPAPLEPSKGNNAGGNGKGNKGGNGKGKGNGIGGGGNPNSIAIVTQAAIYAAQPSLAPAGWGDSWDNNWGG